jgi:hypothetical protein
MSARTPPWAWGCIRSHGDAFTVGRVPLFDIVNRIGPSLGADWDESGGRYRAIALVCSRRAALRLWEEGAAEGLLLLEGTATLSLAPTEPAVLHTRRGSGRDADYASALIL